jgi:hypothetical protein
MKAALVPFGLWFAAFAGPMAWSVHNVASTALVPVACAAGTWTLNLLTIVLALMSIAGVVVAAREPASESGRRFVARTSIIIDLFFAVVIVVEGMPNAILNPCWS